MPPEKIKLARGWFRKALNDLATARHVLLAEPPLTESAVFHCQQAAEKSIKGFLLWYDKPFTKTHNIREISGAAIDIDSDLEVLLREAAELTPYAVAYRYPEDSGEVHEPTLSESRKAIELAQKVYDEVLGRLPRQVRPPSLVSGPVKE